jgi:outer membrane protein TolC
MSQTAESRDFCQAKPSSQQEVIRCAEERSPEVQKALLAMERAKAQVEAAVQWKNPELSIDSLHGKVGTENRSETELGLGIPIELGGKISARRAVANGGVEQAEAELFSARQKVSIETLLKLHRLRQILHEQELVEESISTFSKLVSQYGKRLKLSPEQEMSAAVFRLARSEYDLKKSAIYDEIFALDSFFKTTIGTDFEGIKKILPAGFKTWPKIDSLGAKNSSPQLKLLKAELKIAQAELTLAKSESWPTVIVGPSIKFQTEAGRSDQLYGFNLSLPLPLFNANGAGRVVSALGAKLVETKMSLGISEGERRREELVKSYEHSTAVLGSTLSHQEIEKKHTEIESLFLRGVVPSSLVIEAHRTFVELEKSRNERELKALEALLSIYSLDGKQLETNQ